MISGDDQRSRTHGLATKWLQLQAKAIGIPLLQCRVITDYETDFKKVLLDLKREGISNGIFGDIDFNAHREWISRVCSEVGIKPHFPLWEEDQRKLLKEFIELGFEAVVVATKADLLGEEWLGRKIDHGFLVDLAKLPNVTLCGEAGEYHTLVINGPLFQKKLEILEATKVLNKDHWFLNIKKCY